MAWLLDQFLRFVAWLHRIGGDHPMLYGIFFWSMVAVLVVLVVHIGYTLWVIYERTAHPKPQTPDAQAPARLPESPARRAEALARAGRFTEALAWRYIALVRELDHLHAVTAKDSKTPAEYVAEARLDDDGRATLAELVSALYRHLFGAEPCDAAGYAAFNDAAHAVVGHVAPV
ncbi:MAG TPA: DUF4129 domain-containing protein [Gemmatimonadales bacterium]|nr:DUF4129 domain-containing protein [Gemmatimonadales bacterium]